MLPLLTAAIGPNPKWRDARDLVAIGWTTDKHGNRKSEAIDPKLTLRAMSALGRKNHLFAGSDGGAARWAVVASLLATAKLNGAEPFAYLKDVLERLSSGYPKSRLDELLPWNWAELQAAA